MENPVFHPGMVFTVLNDLTARFGSSQLPSIDTAWDATWLVCVASNPRHEAAARTALANIVIEMEGLPADRLSDRVHVPAAQAPG